MVEDGIVKVDEDDKKRDSLFAQFALTSSYAELQQRMFDLLVENRQAKNGAITDLYRSFVGALYEEIAYFALGERVEPQVLLSPRSTFEYYQLYLYPHTPPLPMYSQSRLMEFRFRMGCY